MQVITSKDNEKIKCIKKLKEKKYRDENSQYIIEGIKIIEEAIKEKEKINTIIICEECLKKETIDNKLLYEIAKYECMYVNEKIFNMITDVTTPQGILAIIDKDTTKHEINYKEDIILLLDNIQDPGNLGTIIRTLDSVNLKQVILSENSTDVYNPKVIRSTMGAIFRVKPIQRNLLEVIDSLKKHQYEILATTLQSEKNIYNTQYIKKAIIIGNEGNGISKEILKKADHGITIPMKGGTESLNASVATGIILYEYARKKWYNK